MWGVDMKHWHTDIRPTITLDIDNPHNPCAKEQRQGSSSPSKTCRLRRQFPNYVMLTQAKVDREGERGKGGGGGRRNERTHDRFRVKDKLLIPRWLSSTGIARRWVYIRVGTYGRHGWGCKY